MDEIQMKKGELREQFLSACNDIASPLLEIGFKATEKGQRLKMKPANKDFTYEVDFESRTYNHPGGITVSLVLSVCSQKAKAYDVECTGNPHCSGIVWGLYLGKFMGKSFQPDWNVASINRDAGVKEITDFERV